TDDKKEDEEEEFPQALKDSLQKKLRIKSSISSNNAAKVVRRSLDARRKKMDHPVFNYVVDVQVTASERFALKWKEQSGRMERLLSSSVVKSGQDDKAKTSSPKMDISAHSNDDETSGDNPQQQQPQQKKVVIVGMGPAGLFCALQLALKSNGAIKPILLDRGQPVEKRGRDIGALMHRRSLDEESNFAFGEGGAGTWSDGKLTTRIGRNSDTVRWVLELLVEFGAPSNILWEGAPHLGTDNLVRLLRNMRHRLEELGGEIHFGTKMTDLDMKDGKVCGVKAEDLEGAQHRFEGDAFVLATGHSARDVYESLHEAGVQLDGKGFAVGRRDSVWANSALVVTVSPDDEILKDYKQKYGVLAGLEFQREMERRASKLGGGNLTVPVQRMTDFCDGKVSTTIPSSSYRLGVKSAPCHEIYPDEITTALRDALTNHFQKNMPGYYHPDGLLHAVETRTSSPLRIPRDPETMIAVGADNLYPSGEGAGFAGGIVSAAVDGVNVGESIMDNLVGTARPDRVQREKSVGFSY
ncbi:MAG: hypothetical protein SGILL_006043, partial [Bacillariaceae sp.]